MGYKKGEWKMMFSDTPLETIYEIIANNAFKLYDGKEKGQYVIKCLDYNCTDENADVTKVINKYNIESYPTIKMLKDGQVIEFDSKITEYTLEQFVNTIV